MNSTLKQLVKVLDENRIQIKKLDIDTNISGEISIEVNNEIKIFDRIGNYALYADDSSVDKTYYLSLTEALEVVVKYLRRVKEDTILVSNNGLEVLKVIPYSSNGLYNLIDVKTNTLVYLKGVSLKDIYDSFVKPGDLQVK
uniref:Uncharacterized protein n=1 Tax=Mammaliicoccus phage MSShimriz1 TaxID=3230127 RepID=A0AAU8GUG4_9VIRU